MRLGLIRLIITSLLLQSVSVATIAAQKNRLVTNRGGTTGELRTYELTASAELIEQQTISTANVGDRLQMDPFGRFLIHASGQVNLGVPFRIDLYTIGGDGLLTLSDSVSRENWLFAHTEHTLTPDARYYVTLSGDMASAETAWYLESFLITEGGEIEETGRMFEIDAFDPVFPIDPIGELGSAIVDDGYILLINVGFEGGRDILVMPMSPSGEITAPTQDLDYTGLRLDWAVRTDQRVVVTGSMDNVRLASFSVSPEGRITYVDDYHVDEYGGLSVGGVTFHPSRLSLVMGGRIASVPISLAGVFFETADFGPLGVIPTAGPGITPDGRLAVATWDRDSSGIHWGVYALNPFGGVELINDHVLPIGYSDIAFIPPRTEEMLGDANADCQRDAADIVTYLNHFNDPGVHDPWAPLSPRIRGPVPEARADADQDGEITWDDLEWLIDFLLTSGE